MLQIGNRNPKKILRKKSPNNVPPFFCTPLGLMAAALQVGSSVSTSATVEALMLGIVLGTAPWWWIHDDLKLGKSSGTSCIVFSRNTEDMDSWYWGKCVRYTFHVYRKLARQTLRWFPLWNLWKKGNTDIKRKPRWDKMWIPALGLNMDPVQP